MVEQAYAPAAERNAAAIIEVLRFEFRDREKVLEIGSGTGQHAVYVGAELPYVQWQTSDLAENHPAIQAWIESAGLANVLPPLRLDVRAAAVAGKYDAVFSANTAHIMSFDAVADMIELVARVLQPKGVFCLYGPFRIDGRFSTESNRQFHASLQAGSAEMGIRDLGDIERLVAAQGFNRESLYAMPANNLAVVWRKGRVAV